MFATCRYHVTLGLYVAIEFRLYHHPSNCTRMLTVSTSLEVYSTQLLSSTVLLPTLSIVVEPFSYETWLLIVLTDVPAIRGVIHQILLSDGTSIYAVKDRQWIGDDVSTNAMIIYWHILIRNNRCYYTFRYLQIRSLLLSRALKHCSMFP